MYYHVPGRAPRWDVLFSCDCEMGIEEDKEIRKEGAGVGSWEAPTKTVCI